MLKAKMGEAVKRPATDSRDTYSFFHPSRFVRHLRLWIGPRERFFFSSLFRLSLYIFMAKPFHNNSEKEWNKYFCFISLRVKCSESFSFFFFLFFWSNARLDCVVVQASDTPRPDVRERESARTTRRQQQQVFRGVLFAWRTSSRPRKPVVSRNKVRR